MEDFVTVTASGGARRSLVGAAMRRLSNFQSAQLSTWMLLVDAQLQKKDGEEVIKLISTLALETDELLARGSIPISDAVEIKAFFASALRQAEGFSVNTVDFVCSIFTVAALVTKRAELMTAASAMEMLSVMNTVMEDPQVTSLSQNCAASGYATAAALLDSVSTQRCAGTESNVTMAVTVSILNQAET
eukprot:3936770-Rhodomonas_salina.1